MRDREVIDQELQLLVVVRAAIRRSGGQPSTAAIDQLLDEWVDSRPAVVAPTITVQ